MMSFAYDVKIIEKGSSDFPKQLYDLEDVPEKLYAIGDIGLLKEFSISVVGARACCEDSAEYAKEISFDLAKKGIVIVSGMACGIDSVAHRGCLEAKGKTIAVLGGGFNDIYPKGNIGLFHEILEEGGLVISEYDLDVPPMRHRFLARNRIVAALSKGLVLIEAKTTSGSITTARYAMNLKRELFVIPGAAPDLDYRGSNELLVQGAKCILNSNDILRVYERFNTGNEKCEIKNKTEKRKEIPKEYDSIYKKLSRKAKTINQISMELNMSISELTSKLTLMEMERLYKTATWKNVCEEMKSPTGELLFRLIYFIIAKFFILVA